MDHKGKIVIGITGYDNSVDAGSIIQHLEVKFAIRKKASETPLFLNEFLNDLRKFIDEKYNI